MNSSQDQVDLITLISSIGLSYLAYRITAYLVPLLADDLVSKGLGGFDMLKPNYKRDEDLVPGSTAVSPAAASVMLPEATGVIAASVYILLLSLFAPLPYLSHLIPTLSQSTVTTFPALNLTSSPTATQTTSNILLDGSILFPHHSFASYLASLLSLLTATFLGFLDDVFDIRWRFKVPIPVIASVPLLVTYAAGHGVTDIVLPKLFGLRKMFNVESTNGVVHLGSLYYIYMSLLSTFCTNSINILAGVNGVEVGQALVIAISIALNDLLYISFDLSVFSSSSSSSDSWIVTAGLARGSSELADRHLFSLYFMLPLIGVSFGLIKHNWYPARAFIGDTYCYFSGMAFAVVGILGHFSKTLLLFFLPQIFNFVYSSPQLFGVLPCPRHRLPRFNASTGLLQPSYMVLNTRAKPLNRTVEIVLKGLDKLKLVKLQRGENGRVEGCTNLTILNLLLVLGGDMREDRLTMTMLGVQVMGSGIAFGIRYGGAGMFYDSNLIATWNFLEEGVDHMMTRLSDGMSHTKYMNLYTVSYNYCTSSRMNTAGINETMGGSGSGRSGANLMGADLYKHLNTYFITHLKTIQAGAEDLSDEPLLNFYTKEWNRYTTAASYINRLFTYLNRHWVKREKDEGRKHVYVVYILALVQWKDVLYKHVQSKHKLTSALLKLIEKQRNGETIESDLVKKVIDSFVSLGLDETDTNRQNLEVYREAFEKPFLAATEVYYTAESQAYIGENSITEYMKKAEARLSEEENRVDVYLHASTRKSLVAKCEEVLVKNHSLSMQEEFQRLLDQEQEADLHRMYLLLSRIPNGLDPLRDRFEAHVKKAGLESVEKSAGVAADNIDPKAYVDSLLSVHKRNADLVTKAFRGDSGFVASLDKACREFVNRNKACPSASKSPELLAKYSDGLLRKSNKSGGEEADLEQSLADTMTVFKYIEDKDVFQKFYSKMLAKRLINQSSASDDAEASMISKLKDACGFEYTSKLQRMFQDMALCKDLNDQFKEKMSGAYDSKELSVDFHVLVLGTAAWPLQGPASDLKMPVELLKTYERFEGFYMNKHSGRKLTWLWQLSRNELRTLYTNQKYQLQVSSYQACVLLQFNSGGDSLSYEDIELGTGINAEALKPVLAMLTKARVIDLKNEMYELNLGFKSKKIRIMLNAPVKSEAKAETADVLKHVDEDRKMLIQAVIVRIMKSRKQLKHQALVTEAITQLAPRFSPRVPDVKKAIDTLIDKEYLARVDGQRDMLEYLA